MKKVTVDSRSKRKSKAKKKKESTAKTKKVTAKKPVKKKTSVKKKITTGKIKKKKTSLKAIAKKTKKIRKTATAKVKGRGKKKREVKIAKKVAEKVTKKIKETTAAVTPAIEQSLAPIIPSLVKIPIIVKDREVEIPQIHEDRIVLLVRDPNWIFAYWDVCDKTLKTFREKLPGSHLALRVYDITGCSPESPDSFFDIDIPKRVGSWHIEAKKPDREFLVEIGLLSLKGDFLTIARSNKVLTPRDKIEITGLEDQETKELYRVAYKIDMGQVRISS